MACGKLGAEVVRCYALGEGGEGKEVQQNRRESYFATGSGVTPYHASSVIQIPSSYRENMLWRCW